MTKERRRALGQGLASLAKASILAFGVPLSLIRLWMMVSIASHNNAWQSHGLWIRVILLIVAILWAKSVLSLGIEIKRAIRGGNPISQAWSGRWAVAIAGLALFISVWHVSTPTTGLIVPPAHATSSRPQPQLSVHATAQQVDAVTTPRIAECLSAVALRDLGEYELWSVLAAHSMDREILPGERFVDASLLRPNWCLPLASLGNTTLQAKVGTSPHHQQTMLEELEWLGLGILGTAALVRRLQALRRAARSARGLGERLPRRDTELEALEARIAPFGEAVLMDWIEVANRQLRRSAGLLRISPVVGLVRAGPTGVTFFFTSAVPKAPLPFLETADGTAWTLPLSAALSSMQVQLAQFGRMIPSLVPIGDDSEHCYLVAVSPGQSLTIDADRETADEIVRGITTGLRTLPWAEELHVELMDLAPPPAGEHCYQMAHSSAAALAELAADPPPPRHPLHSPSWRREPLILTSAYSEDGVVIPSVAAVAGVIQLGTTGTVRLHVDASRARLEPFGIDVRVPRPSSIAADLIERLFERASAIPLLTQLPNVNSSGITARRTSEQDKARVVIHLFQTPTQVQGISGDLVDERRARVIEVLAYLVLHENSCTIAEITEALFPRSGTTAARRIDDALAATRRAIDGVVSISISSSRVTIGEGLSSDWTELADALARAREDSPSEAMAAFTTVANKSMGPLAARYRWMESEGHVARLCFELCDAMHELFALALAQGDLDLAERALDLGLSNEATSELLLRDLMILRNEQGRSDSITECYEQLEVALDEIGGREPTWTTRALFDELAGRSSGTP